MRQYELAIRIAQIHHLVDERKYKKALAVIQTLDVRQVRALSDLKVFAEVYTKTEQFDEAKAMYLRICRSSKTRRVLHRLVYLSIRTNCLEDAEGYYREYMRMNPSVRDALILRYRIDKASGVPIGKLIEVLQELKQEEYIEEWAYELAKLYHRAGRREECMEECKDIMLWFGSGEIVERAKILMDHLKERDPIPYYDDKDFTIPKKEEPNPDDTGSLPDLNEFIKERKALKREERRADRVARKAEADYSTDYKEEDKETAAHGRRKEGELKQPKKQQASDTEFIDDYEEDDFEQDMVLPQVAIGGIHKLSGLLKFGRKDEDKAGRKEKPEQKIEELEWEEEEQERKAPEQNREAGQEKKISAPQEEMSVQGIKLPEQKKASVQEKEEYGEAKEVQKEEEKGAAAEQETVLIKKETPKKKKVEYIPHSQSGTGITQDLAKEITAIYEMEQQEQLKEKAVTVVREREKKEERESMPEKKQDTVTKPAKRVRMAKDARDKTNIATNLVDRMTQAIQKSASKSYIPIDVEEIQRNVQKPVVQDRPVAQPQEKVVRKEPEPEKDSLTIALEKEVAEYQSAAKIQEEQNTEEKPENEEELLKHLLEEEIRDPERLQEPAVYEETEEIASLADEPIETEKADGRQKVGELGEEVEEVEEQQEEAEELQEDVEPEGEIEELQEAAEPMGEAEELQGAEELQEVAEAEELQKAAESMEEAEEPQEAAKPEEEAEEPEEAAKPEEEAEEPQEVAKLQEETEEEVEEPQEATEAEEEAEEPQEAVEAEEEAEEPQKAVEAEEEAEGPQEAVEAEEEAEEPQKIPEQTDEISDMMESTKDLTKEIQAVKKGASILQDYHAPEIPVVETDYAGMPQITYEDLPTTRALQQSFQDVLKLIEGELDPSHFVLMGDGTERIVGVSKKIVHVMKASNYLSRGRIAKIRASQLNKMDLISFRKELRGNCLLIEEASDLLFPTITKIFSIMEEYAGDFVVILSDEGTTLDQLFRFVPVLAKRFKYIIDITKYTEKDYA